MPEIMIECKDLTKRFGHFTAVDHVSFAVEKGSIFGFLGPNGSGKSTVIRMLCGILTPTAGTASIAGVDVVHDTERVKGLIGYMSQKFSLYDELTVHENLLFYGRLYGVERKSASGSARRVDRHHTSRTVSESPRFVALRRLATASGDGLRIDAQANRSFPRRTHCWHRSRGAPRIVGFAF
jgi:ABC-type multidrug transport system ATPase subunit